MLKRNYGKLCRMMLPVVLTALLLGCSTQPARQTACTPSDLVLCEDLRDAQEGERWDYYALYLKFRYLICQSKDLAKAECIQAGEKK